MNRLLHCTISRYQTLIKAIDSVGDPPLPIPNREVKPNSADGTAKICGRVGHRHFYRKGHLKRMSFFYYIQLSMPTLLVVPSFRNPHGMNSVHAACDLLLPAPTNLPSVALWESSGLKALLWEAKASVVATNAPPRWHRHFFSREFQLKDWPGWTKSRMKPL